MQQKHFTDIEVARPIDDEFKVNNVGSFAVGDHISIQEKIDGANSSLAWDNEENVLKAFSRKRELTFQNTLNGFWNYAQSVPRDVSTWFGMNPNMVMFGEWDIGCNKIKDYFEKYKHTWIVYDIYNKETEHYMPQEYVKHVTNQLNLQYIHVLYDGPFISWEHVTNFLQECTYGPTQEGVVIKNQDRLNDVDARIPSYLKIVNADFKEKMKTRVHREKSINEIEEENRIDELIKSIVTRRRVEKCLEKLRDEGILPQKIMPKDMKLVARNIPKCVYDDCVKEEKEIVDSCGTAFGKKCSSTAMAIARQIILG